MQQPAGFRWRTVALGTFLWFLAGAVISMLLVLAMPASTAFAYTGLTLVVLSVGWTLGPFKTPMVWSEGALMSYQGNADPGSRGRPPRGLVLMAVPAFALMAGVLVLAVAGVLAAL